MKTLNDFSVLIIGLGQIGGSIGMDLVQRRLVREVVGFDSDPGAMGSAIQRQAIDRAALELSSAIAEADMVILAAPIHAIIEMLPHVAAHLRAEALCLDVAGTKREIMAAVGKLAGPVHYISGHPIAGNESAGIAGADFGKFKDKTFVLVPSAGITQDQMQLVHQLVESLGAVPVQMAATLHDELIALTSELPYALAMALAHLAETKETDHDAIWQLVGGSFRSATRVAKSSPELTTNMLMSNRREIDRAIDALVAELRNLQKILLARDAEALRHYAESANTFIKKLRE